MATQPVSVNKLNRGLNLRGLTSGINLAPGQAQDALDILPREDGGIYRHWGWLRRNATALNGRVVGIKSFTYKGKNAGAVGGAPLIEAREGNYGIVDDAALGQFSRRQGLYTGGIVLTTTTFYFWRPDTEIPEIQALPGGVTVDLSPKPLFIVVNDNVYIFGYADFNLRYDPTDRALYRLGWEAVPAAIPGGNMAQAAGDLLIDAPYQYSYAFFNLYTGEMSNMSVPTTFTPTVGNGGCDFTAGAFTDYAGARHWDNNTAETRPTDRDVGAVLFRTAPRGNAFYFLDIINPRLAVATFTDNGLATAKGQKALRSDIADEPRFNAADLFGDIIYTISWDSGYNRVYYNDWNGANSYHERWSVLGVSNLPTRHGEALTAVSHTPRSIFVGSQQRGFLGSVTMSGSGRLRLRWQALPWTVGPVGPRAICTAGPWIYFLSERGPYRWREGLVEPQWIGKNLLPMFIDPTSGLCKLNAWAKNQSELGYDQDANVVRWLFPRGSGTFPNTHLIYWIHDDILDIPPEDGWFFASADVQTMDWGNAFTGLNPDGTPADPFQVKPSLYFGDRLGYLNEYRVGHNRGGLGSMTLAAGVVQAAGSTVTNLITDEGGLYQTGDGLAGMIVEVVYSDGSINVRIIVSNTDNDIVPDLPFTQEPHSADWYVAGIPSFWRGVPEHVGDAYSHKDVINIAAKIARMRIAPGSEVIDMSISSGDYPVTYRKSEEIDMAIYHDKTIANMSGRFIQVEFANSRPDGMFCVLGYKWWIKFSETRESDV